MPKLGYVSSAKCKPSGEIGDYSVSFFGACSRHEPVMVTGSRVSSRNPASFSACERSGAKRFKSHSAGTLLVREICEGFAQHQRPMAALAGYPLRC
jgi:hypothetical protein